MPYIVRRNNDGFISPYETFVGLRRVGFGLIFALIGVLVINGSMSYPSCNGIFPDPFFRINIQNISRCKHGSDTGVSYGVKCVWCMEYDMHMMMFVYARCV
ncbi:hypothetical protein EON63_21310 [archaeon]|nr:MAG: hypothetical protein EON63_21310 [archaeon]